ncbi:MAG: gamma-glutamylcyclotransferase family protein [Methylococcaceae bacterium]
MKKGKIEDDTFISAFIDVAEWKRDREKLICGILLDNSIKAEWEDAFELLHTRIKTRFLNPIDWILEKQLGVGEGFSVVALQCILIEFLEAVYQGKIYTTSDTPREFEYKSSKQLFCDFLMNHKPFSEHFTSKAKANGFFDNVRCGLLHEAATKETSRINNAPTHNMIVMFENNDPSNMRIYRENFYQAILEFIELYKSELLSSRALQINFIRKIDDICGIKHNYYFAYGSNMLPERLLERIRKYHAAFPVSLPNYRFTYNKKSINGTAKANIVTSDGTVVYGACFEIDDDDFAILTKYEGGYDRRNITVKTSEGKDIEAVTYISSSIDNTRVASDEYKKLVLKGANYWALDKSYIQEYLR